MWTEHTEYEEYHKLQLCTVFRYQHNNTLSNRMDATETSSWGQQREQSVGQVAGVIDDPPGFPYTPPCLEFLEGAKLTSNNMTGSSHDPLQSFAVATELFPNQAVMHSIHHCHWKSFTKAEYNSPLFAQNTKRAPQSH